MNFLCSDSLNIAKSDSLKVAWSSQNSLMDLLNSEPTNYCQAGSGNSVIRFFIEPGPIKTPAYLSKRIGPSFCGGLSGTPSEKPAFGMIKETNRRTVCNQIFNTEH